MFKEIIAVRPRDMEGVSTILLKTPEYDYQYISRWLSRFDDSLGENFVETFKELVTDIQ